MLRLRHLENVFCCQLQTRQTIKEQERGLRPGCASFCLVAA
jgi:hypothetical protein